MSYNSGELKFSNNIISDVDSKYWLYYASTFNTTGSTQILDYSGNTISGYVSGRTTIPFDFNYDTLQETTFIAVSIGLGVSQYIKITGTLQTTVNMINIYAGNELNFGNLSGVNWDIIYNNPTTIEGYGITNVYNITQTDTLFLGYSQTGHTHTVFDNDITIKGNLKVSGTTYYTDVQHLNVGSNFITLNSGETLSGVTAGFSGIIIDRGEYTDYEFVFDEIDGQTFRIGESGSTQAVATRNESNLMYDSGLTYWNASQYRLDTTSFRYQDISLTSHTHDIYADKNLYNIYTGTTAPATYLPYTISTDTHFTTGVLDRTKSTISFNSATTVFTIAPTSGSYDIYLDGIKYVKTGDTITISGISGFATNKLFFIYYDSAGNLVGSTTAWNINSATSPIATIFWNGSKAILGEERHGASRNLAWHQWAHETKGTAYKSGMDASFTSGSTTISIGIIEDEDIIINTPSTTSLRVWISAPGNTATTFLDTNTVTSSYISGTSLMYDNIGTPTPVSDGYYVKNYIYVTNDIETPAAVIVGQSQYSNVNDARNGAFPTFPTYISAETRLIYITIWKNIGGVATYIESADFRTALTAPNGVLGKRPMYIGELEDVLVTTPAVDDTLRFNGVNWISGPSTSSAGAGVEFFFETPILTGTTTDNTNIIATLGKTPVTTATQTVAVTIATASSQILQSWSYDTALGKTLIDGGTWQFSTYAGVSSAAAGRVSSIKHNIYTVLSTGATMFTSGTLTSRTVTFSTGIPFAVGKAVASATNTVASYLQTPKGLYQITAIASDTVATILVPTTYINETATTSAVWYKLFEANTPTITAISPAYALYTTTSTQGSFVITTEHKLGSISYGTSNNTTSRVITMAYNGTTTNSNFNTPLVITHNELSGKQGGTTNEYYHLTASELYSVGISVPNTRTINNYALSSNITLSLSDIANTAHTHSQYITGFTTGSDKQIIFNSGGTLTGSSNLVYSNGNVGIGITSGIYSPKLTLQVNGPGASVPATTGTVQSGGILRLFTTGGASAILDIGSAGTIGAWLQSTNYAGLSANYPILLNPNGGNIGIGTTTPATILDISGGTIFRNTAVNIITNNSKTIQLRSIYDSTLNLISDTITDGAIIGGLVFSRSNGQIDLHCNVAAIRSRQIGSQQYFAGANLEFFTDRPGYGQTGIPRMVISELGNVGIGDTNPQYKLSISGATSNLYFNENIISSSNNLIVLGSTSASKISVGTTSSSYDISIGGDANRTIGLERNASSTGKDLTLLAGGVYSGSINKNGGNLLLKSGISTGSGSSSISFYTSYSATSGSGDTVATEKMTILGNGNVLINTITDAGYKLQVSGTTLLDGVISTTGGVSGITYTGTGTTFTIVNGLIIAIS